MSPRRIAIVTVSGLCMVAGLILLVWANNRQHTPAVPQTVPTAPALPPGRIALDSHRSLGPSHSCLNLTLIPVYDSLAKPTDTYITLDEGLKAKTVKVEESQEGGDVNTLYVSNTGTKPLYLMAGEVVLGGQQDRCMGKDRIIPPGKKHVPISVYCVEHNRWVGRSEFDSSAKSVASAEIRLQAQDGAFQAEQALALAHEPGRQTVAGTMAVDPTTNSAGNVPQDVVAGRSVTLMDSAPREISASEPVSKAQQQVWAKVAEKNAHMKTESETGTYRNTLNMAGGDAQKAIPDYVKALSGSLGDDSQLVGVIAAVNGKIVAVDIFGEPALFRKLFPKLLNAYAADAVENAMTNGQKASSITQFEAKAFYIQATDGHVKTENKSDISSTLRYDSKDATTYRLVPNGVNGTAEGKESLGSAAKSQDYDEVVHESVLHK